MNSENKTLGRFESDSNTLFTPGRFALLLAAIIVARFPNVVFGKEAFFYRDFGLFGYPLAHYQRECFWRGELPLWNPLNFCGLPFLAQWNTLCLYPPALFYLLLPLPWSLGVFNLGHLFLASLGMYFLAREWTGSRLGAAVAGMAFAFNGLSLNMLMWPNDIAAFGWMPWVVWTGERAWREGGRRVVWAVLAGALQMLSGAPEVILLTWCALGGIWLAQFCSGEIPRLRMVERMVRLSALVAGVAAAQLFPFLELLANSQRDANYGGTAWAMPGWGWANFLVPLFHCSPSIIGVFSQNEQQWTSSYYMGVGILALAFVALWRFRERPGWGLAVAVVAGVVLAMGDHAHLYGWLKRIVPIVGIMRFPIKIVTITVFTLPLLAAFAFNKNSGTQIERVAFRRRVVGIGISLVALTVGILLYARNFPLPDESWPVTRESGHSRIIFLALILGAAFLAAMARSSRTANLAGLTLLLLIAVDALTHAPNQNPTLPLTAYGPLGIEQTVSARPGVSRAAINPALQSFLSHAATADALSYYTGIRRALYLDANLIDDLPTVSGFYSLELKSAAPVTSLLNGEAGEFPGPLADFVGISQVSAPDTSFTWAARTNFLPMVTAGQKPLFASRQEILKAIASARFSPRATVYLSDEARPFVTVSNETVATIAEVKFSAQELIFNTRADAPSLVVVAQAIYRPWHAYVDGARVKLWEANGAFSALEIPAGSHHVKLIYEDRMFQCGAGISVASLIALGLIWFRSREKTS